MADDSPAAVRNPEVRRSLLQDVLVLTRQTHGTEQEIGFGDAVEEVHHLLDPTHGGEPGGVLLDEAEVIAARDLWHALDEATWPLDPGDRDLDPHWRNVTKLASSFLDAASD